MDILHKIRAKRIKDNNNTEKKENPLFNAKNVYNARITELFSKYRFLQLLTIVSMLVTVISISGIIYILSACHLTTFCCCCQRGQRER